MKKFDPTVWEARAWSRFTKAAQADKHTPEKLQSDWVKNVCAISDITKLIEWCKERHIRVNFVKKSLGTYNIHGKTIELSYKLHPPNQSIVFLHECGHHLISNCDDKNRFELGYSLIDPKSTNSTIHRITCLEEEFEAWHRGWKLAQRLNLNTTQKDFDAVKVSCIKTYLKWALRQGTWIDD